MLSQRAYMDRLLYDPNHLRSQTDDDSGRVVVFAFCRAPCIFLRRLLEVSGDKDMRRMVVVALPWHDVIPRAGGGDELAEYFRVHGARVRRLDDDCSAL
jgi:hypothetical protein